ncbi:MAG: urate hydroxylase PuuD [Actinomycetota bacterium]
MEIFTVEGGALLARWTHFLAGITWIGLLYYFNFVQVPFFAEIEPDVRGTAIRKLVPRALAWFRYSAALTFFAGLSLILIRIAQFGWENWDDVLTQPFPFGIPILSGMILGTIMFLNVWGVIWPNQKIVIASAEKTAAGGEADPKAADAGRRGLLASRTNVVLSIPMLFFMATSSHLPLYSEATTSEKALYALIAGGVVLLVELNALLGLTGSLKKPLEKVGSAILSGFGLFAVIYVVMQVITRTP